MSPRGLVCCEVSGQVGRKVQALSAYRSQFALEPGMFPEFLLQEMFGWEYFMAVPGATRPMPAPPLWMRCGPR